MRNLTLAVAALALFLAPGISRAADQPASSQPQAIPGTAPTDPNAMVAPQAGSIQMPPSNWTSLNGTVQAVDASAKTVQIQETTGNLVQVNIDKEVSIQKDGKKVKLSQVQAGDTISLAKKPSSNPSQPKAY